MAINWELQERGWYTSDRGAVLRERDGWWFYPADQTPRYGPFRSMAAAKIAARQSPDDAPKRYKDAHGLS
jgi:hypothetical protein